MHSALVNTSGEINRAGLPNCEALAREILSLPMHPNPGDDQVDRICEAVRTELATVG